MNYIPYTLFKHLVHTLSPLRLVHTLSRQHLVAILSRKTLSPFLHLVQNLSRNTLSRQHFVLTLSRQHLVRNLSRNTLSRQHFVLTLSPKRLVAAHLVSTLSRQTSNQALWLNKYILVFLLIGLTVGCSRAPKVIKPSGKIVEIGVIASLSGQDADVGKSGLEGVKVIVSMQPLLDNGDKVKLVVMDDKSLPEETAEAFDRMQHRKVAGVLLLSKSNNALALAKKNRWMKIPLIATIASHPQLMDYSPYITQLSFDDVFQGGVAAMFMRDELLLDRALVISSEDDAHSSFLAKEFIGRFTATHGVVVEHVVLSNSKSSILDQLQDAKSNGVQLLYIPVNSDAVLHIVEVLDKLRWKPVIMTGDGLLSEILIKYKDKLSMINGIMATDMHSSILAKTEFGEEVLEVFTEQKGKRGSTFTILGSEGAAILMHAMNKAKSPHDYKSVQEHLRNINNFEGFSGTISIDKDGRAIRPVYVNIIDGDKLDLVVKVY